MKRISERLAEAIRRSGKSKSALAAHIGVPQSSVSRWLTGSEPRADRLAEIAKFLSVDGNWLMTGEGSPNPSRLRIEVQQPMVTPPQPLTVDQRLERIEAVLVRIAEAIEGAGRSKEG